MAATVSRSSCSRQRSSLSQDDREPFRVSARSSPAAASCNGVAPSSPATPRTVWA